MFPESDPTEFAEARSASAKVELPEGG
jgi:hypothetical protein